MLVYGLIIAQKSVCALAGLFFISDPMSVSSTRMQLFLLFILCCLYVIVILNVQIKYRMIIKCGLNNAFMV